MKFYLLLLILSAPVLALEQCLPESKAIEGHCEETNKNSCPEGQKLYDCSQRSQLCPDFYEQGPYSFKYHQAAPSTINGTNFPRNERYLFRGVPFSAGQVTFEKLAGATFGDELINVGSVFQWRLSQLLTRKLMLSSTIAHKDTYAEISDVLEDMGVKEEHNKLRKCANTFTQRDAEHYASQLVSKSFGRNRALKKIDSKFLKFDYSSGAEYLEYGNWGQYLIFSSIYYDVASFLSGQIIMFNNRYDRSIDLNYYNHKHGELWTYHDSDNGEFVTPGVILPDELEGLIFSQGDARSSGYLEADAINYAFMKRTIEGENYLLLVDGKGEKCLTKGPDGTPYFCKQKFKDHGHRRDNPSDDLDSHIFGPPKLKDRAPVYAIIAAKDLTGGPSEVSKKAFEGLEISDRKLYDSFLEQVARFKFFKGDKIKGARIILPPVKGGIEVMSASYGLAEGGESENLYPYAARYCDGKSSCDYGVEPGRFFPEFVKSAGAKAEIRFKCDEDEALQTMSAAIGETIKLRCD